MRVTFCTICGSDLHTTLGHRPAPAPSILGHEIIGIVEEIGTDVPTGNLAIGDRITWCVAASCGPIRVVSPQSRGNASDATHCRNCRRGMPQKCDSLFKYGHEQTTDDTTRSLSGGLADYCVLQPGTSIVQLPESLPDEVACPANCATATVMAAIRTAGDLQGKRVLITGAGMLGLTAAAVASVCGADIVVVCDPSAERRQLAGHFGATDTLNVVPEAKFDCIFEMSGNRNAVSAAIDSADVGGQVVLVGSVSPAPPIEFDPERLVRGLGSIHGVHNYRPDDLLTAVHFLNEHHGRFPFGSLVSRSFQLTEAAAAFEFAARHRPVRVAVKPHAYNR